MLSFLAGLFAPGAFISSFGSIVAALITGIFSVITALASSAAGRWFLAACLVFMLWLGVRYYYIQEGRDLEAAYRTALVRAEVIKEVAAKCPASARRR